MIVKTTKVINGVEYECIPYGSQWGNLSIADENAEDTGEPFYFGYGSFRFADGKGHTLTIYQDNIYEKTIDPQYLPKATAIADVTEAPTAENFNALLTALRNAGYLTT